MHVHKAKWAKQGGPGDLLYINNNNDGCNRIVHHVGSTQVAK